MSKQKTSVLQFGQKKRYTKYPHVDQAVLVFLQKKANRLRQGTAWFTAAEVSDAHSLMYYHERSRVSHILHDLVEQHLLDMDTTAKYVTRKFALTEKGKFRFATNGPVLDKALDDAVRPPVTTLRQAVEQGNRAEAQETAKSSLFTRLDRVERMVEAIMRVVGDPRLGNKSWD